MRRLGANDRKNEAFDKDRQRYREAFENVLARKKLAVYGAGPVFPLSKTECHPPITDFREKGHYYTTEPITDPSGGQHPLAAEMKQSQRQVGQRFAHLWASTQNQVTRD